MCILKANNNFVTTRIKHPNFTGLQKDLDSGGYIPEWIVKTIEFNHNGEKSWPLKMRYQSVKIRFSSLVFRTRSKAILKLLPSIQKKISLNLK